LSRSVCCIYVKICHCKYVRSPAHLSRSAMCALPDTGTGHEYCPPAPGACTHTRCTLTLIARCLTHAQSRTCAQRIATLERSLESVQAAERGEEAKRGAPAEWDTFDNEPQMASHPAASWQAAFIEQQVSLSVSYPVSLSCSRGLRSQNMYGLRDV